MKQKYVAECQSCRRRRIETDVMSYEDVYRCDACNGDWTPLGWVDGRVAIIWHEELI